jgi:pimeloyl-ACP methyl ester carboxylesterase
VTEGSESLQLSHVRSDKLVEAVPRAERETIAGAGHLPQATVPDLYAKAIISFARDAEASIPEARGALSAALESLL